MTEKEPNGFTVRLRREHHGWEVQIVDPGGAVAGARFCSDEAEARTYASTVQQHIFWLSPVRFREYYRLDESA
jgi:hypothetical protein